MDNRTFIGGPLCGHFENHDFVSVVGLDYMEATWFEADGSVIAEIYQHKSIKTYEDFTKAVLEWHHKRKTS